LQTVTQNRDVTLSKPQKPNTDGHCYGVTVSKLEIGEEEVPSNVIANRDGAVVGHRCGQCGNDGATLEAHYDGVASAWLHRQCEAAWRAARDLDIPPFLDRRGGTRSRAAF
jgi:hypothetical protein